MLTASPTPATPYERMASLVGLHTPFAVATVVRTHGSTPQVVGAKLILTPDPAARPFGTLGGGCVEADAIDACREVLAGAPPSVREYQLTEELAWNTGLVCGGTMWILAEPGDAAIRCGDAFVLDDAIGAATGGAPVAFVTHLHRQGRQWQASGRVFITAGGQLVGTLGQVDWDERARDLGLERMRAGTARVVSLDEDRELFIEPIAPRPRIVIAGGGHVSKAIARQARLLDFDVTVLEDRPEFADPERFDGATVIGGDVPTAIANVDYSPQTFLVVATRGHKLDADCVLAAVKTGVRYIGLLGSRRKTVLVDRMLADEQIPEERRRVVFSPVGLDLGGRTPAEIALSVVAQIVQLRYGKSPTLDQTA